MEICTRICEEIIKFADMKSIKHSTHVPKKTGVASKEYNS